MQTEERSPVNCLEDCLAYNYTDHDGKSPGISSSCNEPLVPAKRPKQATRQWAAWTPEEEESFFTALRLVGKNFEKITTRVQSKNKDQVRHYYYRLVRRMNKLLGPDLCLDAKNSKDTNAAMLRWWSLLEKHSCKASKLHLKPRRFKLFVEALEQQLLKDRKKTVKKRLSQGDHASAPSPTSIVHQNKSPGVDTRPAKVIVDNQNVPKSGNGNGSSTRRNPKLGVNRNNNKGETFPKSTRQRRKTGAVSAAAIKRWEKAAMAGVSLVADAAEHVERTAVDNQADLCGGLTFSSIQAVGCGMDKNGLGPSEQIQSNAPEKLKLQLFPIDDTTRKALEMDKHNPHLELTLSSRKKISSVLEHLGRKWGSSSVVSGQLMLFSFDMGYQRWKQDSTLTAVEVYALIGKPPVFRLRYGWVKSTDLQSAPVETPPEVSSGGHKCESEGKQAPEEHTSMREEEGVENHVSHSSSHHQPSGNHSTSVEHNKSVAFGEAYKKANVDHNGDSIGSASFTASVMVQRNDFGYGSTLRIDENVVDCGVHKRQVSSAGEWDDSLTNVSVGDLLNDGPDDMDANCVETSFYRDSSRVEEVPFTCDSFDAAIAAHIYSQNKTGFSGYSTNLSSIWDAEETCDEFSFHKQAIANKPARDLAVTAASDVGEELANTSSVGIRTNHQDTQQETLAEDTRDIIVEFPSECHQTESSVKDFSILADMYWPDSLGTLELDVPSCKYYSEDLILSDSLSGLNRLIANSLDAFHYSPLFGLDEKGMSPTAGARGGASFPGKIGRGDNPAVPSVQV